MVDTVSAEKRSEMMAGIPSVNTQPELAVRSFLHRKGLRFRLHRKDLPGKPDIVLPRFRAALFVHGCFWHQHEGCSLASRPKSNKAYWAPKLERNLARDAENRAALEALGWRVAVIWECDARNPDRLRAAVIRALADCGILPPPSAGKRQEATGDS